MLKDIELFKTHQGGPFIDFIVSISKEENDFLDKKDLHLYLIINVFDPLFIHSFKIGNQTFDVSGGCISFDGDKLKIIVSSLKGTLEKLNDIHNKEDLSVFLDNFHKESNVGFLENMEIANIDIDKDWKILIEKLKMINKELMDVVIKCMNENKILWVCGV